MKWKIELTATAVGMLSQIRDRRVQEGIRGRIDGLANEPDKQGYPLIGELSGYRSLRAMGQRYRIIYRLDGNRVTVLVVATGLRKEGDKKDIYALAQKLIRSGLGP